MSADSGAAPETKNRIRPPVRAFSLLKTSRSASVFLILSPPGIGSPARTRVAHLSPARFAQKKIVRLMALPDSAFSSTRAYTFSYSRHRQHHRWFHFPQVCGDGVERFGVI